MPYCGLLIPFFVGIVTFLEKKSDFLFIRNFYIPLGNLLAFWFSVSSLCGFELSCVPAATASLVSVPCAASVTPVQVVYMISFARRCFDGGEGLAERGTQTCSGSAQTHTHTRTASCC